MPTAAFPSYRALASHHRRLLAEVEAFTTERIAPLTQGLEARGPHTDTFIREALSGTGWLGVHIPARWGGLGLGHVANALITETLSWTSPAAGATYQASILGGASIVELGSEEMCNTWLPEIAAGRCWPTIAVTDPDHGCHVLGMECTARPAGDGYVLNGEKVLVGNAALGDIHCVVARTGDRGDRRGLTAFLVEKDTEGLDIRPGTINGLHGFSVDTLRMTDVHVPADRIIGDVGDGEAVAQRVSVIYGRLNLASLALGIQRRLLGETQQYLSTRPRYSGSLSGLKPTQRRIAEMLHHVLTTEHAIYRAAQLLDQGTACDPLLYNAKLTAHRAGTAVSEHAKQLYGGHAGHPGTLIEQLRRDGDLVNAPAGPEDIQLHYLAAAAQGRPTTWSAQHIARRAALA